MNNERRKVINNIITDLRNQEPDTTLDPEHFISRITDVKDEEEAAFDGLLEHFQSGSRGEAMQQAIENLDYAIDSLTYIDESDPDIDIPAQVDEAINYLKEAVA